MCHPVCIRDGRTAQKLCGTLGKLTLVILCWFFSPLSSMVTEQAVGGFAKFFSYEMLLRI